MTRRLLRDAGYGAVGVVLGLPLGALLLVDVPTGILAILLVLALLWPGGGL